ncbi:hypothetical protein IAT38_001143 [Cryptococcus sp. DSM 104549]
MSSTVSIFSATPSTSQTASASASSTSNGNSPGSFYKNLFYILIGLLCAFGLISFISLMRARRRRHAIINEAERLGVMVPGVPGYIPMRDRRAMIWDKADGSKLPDWWEVEKAGSAAGVGAGAGTGGGLSRPWDEEESDEFYPLGVIPPPPPRQAHQPIELSPLPFFPNHLAYRPSSLRPPPARFTGLAADNLAPLEQLAGGGVEVVTIIRMPAPESTRVRIERSGEEEEDGEEVIREWGGIELGIAKMGVVGGGGNYWRGAA